MKEELQKLSRADLDTIAIDLKIATTIENNSKPRDVLTLIGDINDAITSKSKEDAYDFVKKYFTVGKFDCYFFVFKNSALVDTDMNIEDKFIHAVHNDYDLYIPKDIYGLFNDFILMRKDSLIICIRKHLNAPFTATHCRKILKDCFGLGFTNLYDINFLKNRFKKICNDKLAIKYINSKQEDCYIFYNSHAASGKYLTVSSKLLSSNEKIYKDMQISEGQDDLLFISQIIRQDKLDKIKNLVEYAVIKAPQEVINAIVEIRFDFILKNNTGCYRYKINLKNRDIKILNLDTTFDDVFLLYNNFKELINNDKQSAQ